MTNPAPEIINDDQFQKLSAMGIINETAVRNIEIRERFAELKKGGGGSVTAIYHLMEEYNMSRKAVEKVVYS